MLNVVQETNVSAAMHGVAEQEEVERSSRKHTACPAAWPGTDFLPFLLFLPDLIFSCRPGSFPAGHNSLECSPLSTMQLEIIKRMSEKDAAKFRLPETVCRRREKAGKLLCCWKWSRKCRWKAAD